MDKNHYHGLVRREMFPLLPSPPGKVLDVGGGYGGTSAAIKRELGAELAVVIDLFVEEDGMNDEIDALEIGDANDPVFCQSLRDKYGLFDTILCLDVLEHLVDPWSAVKALTDLLKPGGSIVASIPNINHYSAFFPLLFKGKWELSDSGILDRTHLRFFVKKTAIELMTSSGLKMTAFDVNNNWKWENRYRMPHRMPFGIGERFVAMQYLIRVEKDPV